MSDRFMLIFRYLDIVLTWYKYYTEYKNYGAIILLAGKSTFHASFML